MTTPDDKTAPHETRPDATTPDETAAPGKTRTWWHPLLVGLLKYALGPAYEVRDEVSVGTLPLRADIVLLRREQAEVPELGRRSLPALVECLNRWKPTGCADRASR